MFIFCLIKYTDNSKHLFNILYRSRCFFLTKKCRSQMIYQLTSKIKKKEKKNKKKRNHGRNILFQLIAVFSNNKRLWIHQ